MQIRARFDGDGFAAHFPVFSLDVDFKPRLKSVFIGNGKQFDIRLVKAARRLVARYAYLLDKPHLVSVNRG